MTIATRAAIAALALLAAEALAPAGAEAATAVRERNGALRFYDDNGNDRGYAWCLRRSGRWFGSSDCSYYTLPQCRAAGQDFPGGECDPNPFSLNAKQVKRPPR